MACDRKLEETLWDLASQRGPTMIDISWFAENASSDEYAFKLIQRIILDAIDHQEITVAAMHYESFLSYYALVKDTNARFKEIFSISDDIDAPFDAIFDDTATKASLAVLHTPYPSGQKYPTPPRTSTPSVKEAEDVMWRLWGVSYNKAYDRSDFGRARAIFNGMVDHAFQSLEQCAESALNLQFAEAAYRYTEFLNERDMIVSIRNKFVAHRMIKRGDIDEIMTVFNNSVNNECDMIANTLKSL